MKKAVLTLAFLFVTVLAVAAVAYPREFWIALTFDGVAEPIDPPVEYSELGQTDQAVLPPIDQKCPNMGTVGQEPGPANYWPNGYPGPRF